MRVLATSGGINWCWYHEYEITGDDAVEVRSYRLHKFEEDRGAKEHPDAEWSVEHINPSPAYREQIGLGAGEIVCLRHRVTGERKHYRIMARA